MRQAQEVHRRWLSLARTGSMRQTPKAIACRRISVALLQNGAALAALYRDIHEDVTGSLI
ncbi:hypothetical protein BKM20_15875 [Pseudomonas avellanae]|uniref:Uncharacterized protein n=2 Tax=Pseudomonas avellanae TaxID=46257 RepID=A0AAD0GT56_9PSED|nr:hypothetical protein BKM03_28710 [Pseudomonas avellanae]KWS54142.1 hypothetical protein AL055_09450 [Pseudomonas amygdali pv. morsprunorum]POC91185.1 hypothetical protein BKM26_16065 [Pseudomonas avellanae]POD07567.1 hypothetical protein BKM20_15875 [Pseudomonas avellanae]POP84944.1 hypothetical protein CXB34_19485 [Pseudomonas amygdali pv. morsprunorum]